MAIKALIFPVLGALMCIGAIGCGEKSHPPETHYWNAEVLVPFGHRPMPSPDGQWIAFGGTGDSSGIWVLDRLTSDLVRLTDNAHPHRWDYQWTDDSGGLVFGGAGESGTTTSGIWYVTCPDGSIMLLFSFGSDPTVSGDTVCFAGNSTSSSEAGIWLVGLHSPQFFRLRETGTAPEFSPSGLSIAYLLPISNAFPELHIMSSAGTGDQMLANDIISQEWLDNGSLICTQSDGVGSDLVKVTIGPSPQIIILASGASQFAISATDNLIVFQAEEHGQSLGLHVTSPSGGQSTSIRPSGAYPQFLPSIGGDNQTRIIYEDLDGIVLASSSSGSTPQPVGLNP
jgi:hypothetical protein